MDAYQAVVISLSGLPEYGCLCRHGLVTIHDLSTIVSTGQISLASSFPPLHTYIIPYYQI